MTNRIDIKNAFLALLLSFLFAVMLIFYNKAVFAQGTESYIFLIIASITSLVSLKVLLVIAVLSLLIYVCLTQGENVSNFIYKHRFSLCAITFLVLVGFGISGSSIGMWSLSTGEEDAGLLVGTLREIRSDEWVVSTPLALSQYVDSTGPFQYFSNVTRGTTTDVFLQSGQPVRDIVEIFRPFHWGFIFLPPAQGLSFCWCGRLIALFIVSFEMGRFITDDRRHLALIYACLLTFSPTVQWWFSTGVIAEILIYSQLATLVFKEFLLANGKCLRRVVSISIISICVGAYALTLYPKWQIPVAYVILMLEIYVFITYKKFSKFGFKEIIACACCVAIFIAIFSRSLILSKDTITTMMNTAYPGITSFHGGGYGPYLFNYLASIFFPFKQTGFLTNVCEYSTFIDFFPLCLIIPLYVTIKNKERDFLLISLIVVVLVFDAYAVIGLPPIIEKITLLDKCNPVRVIAVVGFPCIILLIRSLSMIKLDKKSLTVICSILFGIFAGAMSKTLISEYVTTKMALFIAAMFGFLFYLALNHDSRKNICTVVLVSFMVITGGLVNPVQIGLDCVYENPVYKMVEQIHNDDKTALWASEVEFFGNFLITAGAPTVNSTNIYPVKERWSQLDTNLEHEETYNRYAHIELSLKKDGDTSWDLISDDVFSITMTPEDAKTIGIKYIFTTNNLGTTLGEDKVSLVSQTEKYRVYELL